VSVFDGLSDRGFSDTGRENFRAFDDLVEDWMKTTKVCGPS
jgi:hypothetical protein